MPPVTIVLGLLLVALGAGGWFAAPEEHRSWTAWIPAFVGGPLLLLGLAALREGARKHAMHAAAVVGLLGLLAGVGNVVRMVGSGKPLQSLPGYSTLGLTLLCLVFVVLCVNSFIQARLARKAREAGQGVM